jgi:hypothetical protein
VLPSQVEYRSFKRLVDCDVNRCGNLRRSEGAIDGHRNWSQLGARRRHLCCGRGIPAAGTKQERGAQITEPSAGIFAARFLFIPPISANPITFSAPNTGALKAETLLTTSLPLKTGWHSPLSVNDKR